MSWIKSLLQLAGQIGSRSAPAADDVARAAGSFGDDAARIAGSSADDVVRGSIAASDDVIRSAGRAADYASDWTNTSFGARTYEGMKNFADTLKRSSSPFVRAGGHTLNVTAETARHAQWAVPSGLIVIYGAHGITQGRSTEIITSLSISTFEGAANVVGEISPEMAQAIRNAAPEALREAVEIMSLPSHTLATSIRVGSERAGHPISEADALGAAQALHGDWLFAALPVLTRQEMSEAELASIAVAAYRSDNVTEYLAGQLGITTSEATTLRETLSDNYNSSIRAAQELAQNSIISSTMSSVRNWAPMVAIGAAATAIFSDHGLVKAFGIAIAAGAAAIALHASGVFNNASGQSNLPEITLVADAPATARSDFTASGIIHTARLEAPRPGSLSEAQAKSTQTAVPDEGGVSGRILADAAGVRPTTPQTGAPELTHEGAA